MDFITQIRKDSTTLHSASEHTGFIKRILDGNASVDGYAEYIFNLSAMYKCIEGVLDRNSSNELVKDFVTPELYRYNLIQKDLEFLLGSKIEHMELLSSTKAFIDKINDLEKVDPILIVAYAYTRFIADLFGGRTFASLLSTAYKISPEGLNYYNCDKIKDIRSYVMGYASKLNNLNLDDNMKAKFINEVNNAYIYNLAISNELEAKLHMN